MEQWKIYEVNGTALWVSSYGNIVRFDNGKLVHQRLVGDIGRKYFSIRIQRDCVIKEMKVHRMVAECFVDNPHNKPMIKHKDGNKLNNCSSNLEWCTNQENIQHAHDTGLVSRVGSKNSKATLNEDQVHIICKWFEDNPTLGAKAAKEFFDIKLKILTQIRCGQSWKHVRKLYNIPPLNSRAKFND